MVFSSLVFLCAFLPCAFVLDRLMPTVSAKNGVLIALSLLFYAYGEPVLVLLMLASTVCNYVLGLLVGGSGGGLRKLWLVVAVLGNLGALGVFKYAGMIVETANALLGLSLAVPAIPLPLGISFYTFQALSYVIDVYRGDVVAQRSYARVLLYISFFPQLVAGPIVKYHDIEQEMESRHATLDDTALGLRRFTCGLAKKVLVANVMASCADALYACAASEVGAVGALLAAFAYLLQIYFDFSGYSDMAIGLGRVFGFHFQENFAHPYSSTSVKEFWRRWHISLSTWLREYLYFPLGGNRRGRVRAALNRIIVFFLCGLWHGASWTFVVWGLLHGMMLLMEDVVPLKRLPRFLGHAYTLVFVMLTFVVFRCDTLHQAASFLGQMYVGWRVGVTPVVMAQLTPLFVATAVAGVLLAGSVPERVVARMERPGIVGALGANGAYLASLVLMVLCAAALASGTYNPFIYFRF